MKFQAPLTFGTLIKRYKRFMVDVELHDGRIVTAHLANSGSMMGLKDPGLTVALSYHDNPKRKFPYSMDLVKIDETWVCVNTQFPNRIVEEAILAKRIGPLRGYPFLRREVAYGNSSRIDLLLGKEQLDNPNTIRGKGKLCYVEVKNVTLREGRTALFPDAVTARGKKHLHELMDMAASGHRAVMLFFVGRNDCTHMAPARKIDLDYANTLAKAADSGVELLAYRAKVSPAGIEIEKKVPVAL